MHGDREVRDNRFLGDLLRRWHAAVGSREVTVAQISARLGLTIDTNVRLGHGLRSAKRAGGRRLSDRSLRHARFGTQVASRAGAGSAVSPGARQPFGLPAHACRWSIGDSVPASRSPDSVCRAGANDTG
jgi:hypothetical protein